MTPSEKKALLCDFFKFFRTYGEANIGVSIESFVDLYLKTLADKQNPQ